MLTAERLREVLAYDQETGILTWKYQVSRNIKPGQVAGCINQYGYRKVAIDKKTMLVHRVIWAIVHGEFPNGLIDHINRDRLDNRISNLRIANDAQNAANKSQSPGARNIRGVTRLKSGKFQAAIGGGRKYLGVFDTAEDAKEFYELASAMLYGEFSPYYKAAQRAAPQNKGE